MSRAERSSRREKSDIYVIAFATLRTHIHITYIYIYIFFCRLVEADCDGNCSRRSAENHDTKISYQFENYLFDRPRSLYPYSARLGALLTHEVANAVLAIKLSAIFRHFISDSLTEIRATEPSLCATLRSYSVDATLKFMSKLARFARYDAQQSRIIAQSRCVAHKRRVASRRASAHWTRLRQNEMDPRYKSTHRWRHLSTQFFRKSHRHGGRLRLKGKTNKKGESRKGQNDVKRNYKFSSPSSPQVSAPVKKFPVFPRAALSSA